MKICRFDTDRLGLLEGETVLDVSAALQVLPPARWPFPSGDLLIANLDAVRGAIERVAGKAPRLDLAGVCLKSPVANPSKIIGAPVNYREHYAEAQRADINHGHDVKSLADWGLFLKANTALVGPGEGIKQRFRERRNDHEIELAVIIGRRGNRIAREAALAHVAGYAIGLDMTVRGPQFQSFRKSIDTYAVVGPWMVTADEITNPDELDFHLELNGVTRQAANTRMMHFDVARLIEFASSYYTLYPGDIIMTGTPAGVGPVQPGDVIHACFERIGAMSVRVEAA